MKNQTTVKGRRCEKILFELGLSTACISLTEKPTKILRGTTPLLPFCDDKSVSNKAGILSPITCKAWLCQML